jgi:hypothetical protein
MLRHLAGLLEVAGVPRRLTATRLIRREIHLHVERSQEPNGIGRRLCEESISDARDEEGNSQSAA